MNVMKDMFPIWEGVFMCLYTSTSTSFKGSLAFQTPKSYDIHQVRMLHKHHALLELEVTHKIPYVVESTSFENSRAQILCYIQVSLSTCIYCASIWESKWKASNSSILMLAATCFISPLS